MTRGRVLAAALIAAIVLPALGAERGPSTAEEREKVVRLARQLEQAPLASSARESREWLTIWLIEVPDVSVTVCANLVEPILGSKKKHASELVTQMMYSSAAWVIDHPEQADDLHAMYLAGVEGTLRAYESILRDEPDSRWKFLDELVARREAGTLTAYVREIMPECE